MTTEVSAQIDSIEAYQAFILIYAAHADIQFSLKEKQMIANKFGKNLMEQMTQLYYSMSEFRALETIKALKSHYLKNIEAEQKTRSNIISIFEADGEYSRAEKSLLFFLDHYLELAA